MMENAISSKGLTKRFGNFTAVDHIDLNISLGSIHGFIGPNGAGKTTTIKMLIGAINPTEGSGLILNYPIGEKESRQVVGYVPEKATFYKDLNSIEYLIYTGQLAGLSYSDAVKRGFEVLDLFGLVPHAYKKPIHFSSGMKKKLIIAQSLMHRPKILILDEPTANLDPESRMFIIEVLRKLVKEENLTVFISSHILTELELVVNEITFIKNGKLILSGKISDIRNLYRKGVIDISSSNNELLKKYLEKVDYIEAISLSEEGYLRIATKEDQRLRKEIGKMMDELGISLNLFTEEFISLDNIYRQVYRKGDEN